MWQTLIFLFAYGWFHVVYDPLLWIYRQNNKHVPQIVTQRTLDFALAKEKEHKRKLKEVETAEE